MNHLRLVASQHESYRASAQPQLCLNCFRAVIDPCRTAGFQRDASSCGVLSDLPQNPETGLLVRSMIIFEDCMPMQKVEDISFRELAVYAPMAFRRLRDPMIPAFMRVLKQMVEEKRRQP